MKFDPKKQQHSKPVPERSREVHGDGRERGPVRRASDGWPQGHAEEVRLVQDEGVSSSRRTCALPQYAYEAIKYNAANSELSPDGDGIKNFRAGYPFPIPNNAMELMHDKRFSYRGYKATRQFAAAPVQSNGSFNLITVQDEAIFRYANPAVKNSDELNNIGLLYIANTIAPGPFGRQRDLGARVDQLGC